MGLLNDNQDSKVGDLMGQLNTLTMTKVRTTSTQMSMFIINAKDETVGINCYYFGRWMPLVGDKAVAFGLKKSTSTGFNTMCVEGSKLWNARNNEAKKAQANLMEVLSDSKLIAEVSDVPKFVAERNKLIASIKSEVKSTKLGFETKDELMDYLKAVDMRTNVGASAQA